MTGGDPVHVRIGPHVHRTYTVIVIIFPTYINYIFAFNHLIPMILDD
jgi:hypothetical protein